MGRLKAMKKSRLVVLAVFAVYLAVVSGFTIYSQTGYIANLPAVALTKPGPAEIPFTLEGQAQVQDGALYYHHPPGLGLPNDVIIPGQAVQLTGEAGQKGTGTVRSIAGDSLGMGGAEIWFTIDRGGFGDGELVNFTVEGQTLTYSKAIPRAALRENSVGEAVLYTIDIQDGPWGPVYKLKENACGQVWPYNSQTEYVQLPYNIRTSGEPIVLAAEDELLYSGMEVRLVKR